MRTSASHRPFVPIIRFAKKSVAAVIGDAGAYEDIAEAGPSHCHNEEMAPQPGPPNQEGEHLEPPVIQIQQFLVDYDTDEEEEDPEGPRRHHPFVPNIGFVKKSVAAARGDAGAYEDIAKAGPSHHPNEEIAQQPGPSNQEGEHLEPPVIPNQQFWVDFDSDEAHEEDPEASPPVEHIVAIDDSESDCNIYYNYDK